MDLYVLLRAEKSDRGKLVFRKIEEPEETQLHQFPGATASGAASGFHLQLQERIRYECTCVPHIKPAPCLWHHRKNSAAIHPTNRRDILSDRDIHPNIPRLSPSEHVQPQSGPVRLSDQDIPHLSGCDLHLNAHKFTVLPDLPAGLWHI